MYYFTVNYSTICYSTTTPAVCISETDLRRFTQDFTILLFYYYSTTTPAVCISETDLRRFTQDFNILLFCYFNISVLYYSTMYYFTVNNPNIYYSTTTPAVCISETDLRRFTQDFTILLFQYCTLVLCTIFLLTIPLFAILPRPQPFASRKPTCAGSPSILLFYYHDPSRLAILLFYSTTTPAVCISQTHLYRLYHKVCISETDLRRFTQHFTILLPRPQPFASRKPTFTGCTIKFASRKPTCAGSPSILLFYYHDPSRLAILLFYSTTTSAVCISQTHLYRLCHKVCISETELCMLTPKFAC